MKMKKVLSAVLVTAMAASMAACGGNSTSTTAAAAESTTAAAASSENESTESEATSEAEETTEVTASGDSDWAYIEGKGKMTIGVTMFAPMNYEENGELIGFDTELAKAVCEKIGVEADFIEINWDSKEIELNSKNIDWHLERHVHHRGAQAEHERLRSLSAEYAGAGYEGGS